MSIAVAAVGTPIQKVVSAQRKTTTDVTFDSSYPTGGESVTAAQLNLNIIEDAVATVKAATGGGVNVANVHASVASTGATLNLLVYDETPAEVTDTNDLSTLVVRVVAFGK